MERRLQLLVAGTAKGLGNVEVAAPNEASK